MMSEAINLRPTWEACIYEALRVLPHSTLDGARQIHDLILQAARVADLHVAHVDAAEVAAQEEPKPGRYRLSFTIDTDADPSDLLDRLTEYAEGLEEDLEPATDWTGSVEIPATVPRHSITVEVTA